MSYAIYIPALQTTPTVGLITRIYEMCGLPGCIIISGTRAFWKLEDTYFIKRCIFGLQHNRWAIVVTVIPKPRIFMGWFFFCLLFLYAALLLLQRRDRFYCSSLAQEEVMFYQYSRSGSCERPPTTAGHTAAREAKLRTLINSACRILGILVGLFVWYDDIRRYFPQVRSLCWSASIALAQW